MITQCNLTLTGSCLQYDQDQILWSHNSYTLPDSCLQYDWDWPYVLLILWSHDYPHATKHCPVLAFIMIRIRLYGAVVIHYPILAFTMIVIGHIIMFCWCCGALVIYPMLPYTAWFLSSISSLSASVSCWFYAVLIIVCLMLVWLWDNSILHTCQTQTYKLQHIWMGAELLCSYIIYNLPR